MPDLSMDMNKRFMYDLAQDSGMRLFLFASAYTLKEDAHVRVDVFAQDSRHKTKSVLNMIGVVFLYPSAGLL